MKFVSLFKKSLQIKVNSAAEYFLLPKSERTNKFGFYKVPCFLPWTYNNPESDEGWDAFKREIRKQFPIQWFFRDWLLSLDNPVIFWYYKFIGWPLRDFKWALRLFCKPLFPRWRKALPRHQYMDICELVVLANFALIQDFFYEEADKGIVDWNATPAHKKFFRELKKAIRWIEVERPKMNELESEELTKATENKVFKNKRLDYHKTYKNHDKIVNKIKNKDTAIN